MSGLFCGFTINHVLIICLVNYISEDEAAVVDVPFHEQQNIFGESSYFLLPAAILFICMDYIIIMPKGMSTLLWVGIGLFMILVVFALLYALQEKFIEPAKNSPGYIAGASLLAPLASRLKGSFFLPSKTLRAVVFIGIAVFILISIWVFFRENITKSVAELFAGLGGAVAYVRLSGKSRKGAMSLTTWILAGLLLTIVTVVIIFMVFADFRPQATKESSNYILSIFDIFFG